MNRKRGFTLVESIAVLAIIGVLYAILRPVLLRPTLFTRLPIAPLDFHNATLQTVVARLDDELSKHQRRTLSRVLWETPTLKKRKVSLHTRSILPLGAIFKMLEHNAQIRFDTGGLCGSCGGPIAPITVRDAKNLRAK